MNIVSEQKKLVRILGALLHRRRRTGVKLLKLVIFHLMQRHFADFVRSVAFCNT